MTLTTHSSTPCLKNLMVLHTGFFTKTIKPSPIGTDQVHPPIIKILYHTQCHHGNVSGCSWGLTFTMFPAGCSGFNKELLLFIAGKETPSCPYQTYRHFIPQITVHSSLSLGLQLFSKLCQTENTSFLEACCLILDFHHSLLLLLMLQRRVQCLPNRCDMGGTWTWGAIPKIFTIIQPPVIS